MVDPAILSNFLAVAHERGLSIEQVAAMVEPESALLAQALRECDKPTRKAAPAKETAAAAPRSKRGK